MNNIRFSFCTTCRGRFRDLALTLPSNLALLAADEEIVLLDYNCPEYCGRWAAEQFHDCRQLQVWRECTAPRFIMAHAKNIAHRLGQGRVLVNIDADHYLNAFFLKQLRSMDFADCFMAGPCADFRSWGGRIAVRRDIFQDLGGYDEDYIHGWGCEDTDLADRGRVYYPGHYRTFDLGDNCLIDTSYEQRMIEQGGLPLEISCERHRRMSERNMQLKSKTVNAGRPWGTSATLVRLLPAGPASAA